PATATDRGCSAVSEVGSAAPGASHVRAPPTPCERLAALCGGKGSRAGGRLRCKPNLRLASCPPPGASTSPGRRRFTVCLLVVLAQIRSDLPLVVAANRDELLERPAEPMTVLRDANPRILGGRDE